MTGARSAWTRLRDVRRAGAANDDVGDGLSRWSPGRELLFDPPETLEIGITPFLVALVQLVECRVSEVRVHDPRADLVLLALVIKLEIRHHREEYLKQRQNLCGIDPAVRLTVQAMSASCVRHHGRLHRKRDWCGLNRPRHITRRGPETTSRFVGAGLRVLVPRVLAGKGLQLPSGNSPPDRDVGVAGCPHADPRKEPKRTSCTIGSKSTDGAD